MLLYDDDSSARSSASACSLLLAAFMSVNAVLTFSMASKLFADTYSNLSLEELNLLKLNPDFVVSACNIVENLHNPKHKTNKKDLAIGILKQCLDQKKLGYFGDELKHLDVIIESSHSNGKIKRISLKKKVGNKFSNFFLSLLN